MDGIISHNSSAMFYFKSSYKRRIVILLIASVEKLIKVGDIENAEIGLVSILNVVGFLSTEVFGVFFYSTNCLSVF